ncbi:hypothetical protein ECPA48_0274 [Escherichia coli PA48]|nr:hypothetical protein EC100869_0274 [Escherichia coli 10.0869]ELW06548.1 hypothetical protein ECPA48_0274 [Escherichia coli PA48]
MITLFLLPIFAQSNHQLHISSIFEFYSFLVSVQPEPSGQNLTN